MQAVSKRIDVSIGVFCCCLFACTTAFSANLSSVRTGNNATFVRVVFEFDAAVTFQMNDSPREDTIALTFANARLHERFERRNRTPTYVRSIDIRPDGDRLASAIVLSQPPTRLETLRLSQPDRVVVDIFQPMSDLDAPRLNELVIKDAVEARESAHRSATEAPGDDPLPGNHEARQQAPTDEAMTENSTAEGSPAAPDPKVDTGAGIETNLTTSPSIQSSEPLPRDTRKTRQTTAGQAPPRRFSLYLVGLLALLSIVIVALAGFILLQKKRPAPSSRAGLPQHIKHRQALMATLDAKIKAKLKAAEHE